MEHVPVVVVGCGPTGASAAIMLGRRGIDTLVLERWPKVYPLPRARSARSRGPLRACA
jgi:3-(3-hydroxy-phenyl)propionate hydroxylase